VLNIVHATASRLGRSHACSVGLQAGHVVVKL